MPSSKTMQGARRITQAIFLALFFWLLLATFYHGVAEEEGSLQDRLPYPVSLFLQIDPLAAVSTFLYTGTIFVDLLPALAVIALTVFLGRWFCGWVCPFGTLHQIVGWLGRRRRPAREQIAMNRPSRAQSLKVAILIAFLAASALGSTHVGWLDPIAFLTRAVDLVLLPLADRPAGALFSGPRVTLGAWVIGGLALAALLANLWVPRFYCRFLCPTGALLGWIGRWAPWRIGLHGQRCTSCGVCDRHCEGACDPAGVIRQAECVLCWNCVDSCPHDAIGMSSRPPEGGEIPRTDLTRRALAASLVGGVAAAPLLALDGHLGAGRSAGLVRPPGALPEDAFLARCVACGRCMRACPTNVLQPAGLAHGLEALWTPVLDMRVGTSGCQPACVACGHSCPTGAIRPLGFDEKMGLGPHADQGPLRIGLAVVDRDRCLPWSFGRPCIVCEEVCPVSPKAIRTEVVVEDGVRLQRPHVNPDLCTGCGPCEHACPVKGQRAIRVTAENETRSGERVTLTRREG